jgi:exopolysaccharide biosynthesis polyprenyl glycosylphosphotransferase
LSRAQLFYETIKNDLNAVGWGAAVTGRTVNVAQDLQGLRFDVSDTPALHVVDPPVEPAVAPLSRARWERKIVRRILVTDAVVVGLAVMVAHTVRYYAFPVPQALLDQARPGVWTVSIAVFIGWMIALAVFRTRDPKTLDSGVRHYQAVARSTFTLFAWVAITALLFKWQLSRGFIAISFTLGLSLLFLERRAWGSWMLRQRRKGRFLANVLVIGGVRSAKAMTLRFSAGYGSGFRVVGVWVPDRTAAPDERFHVDGTAVPVMGTESDLGQALAVDAVDTVVVTDTEHLGHDGMRELAWALEDREVNLLVAPNVVDVAGPRIHLQAHGNMPLIYLSGPSYSRARTLRRAVFDRSFAAAVLLASSPVLLLAALAVRVSSRGPIFYRSERIGAHGVPFQMLKLRTMVQGADQMLEKIEQRNDGAGPMFKVQMDPRVTRVGRFLRRYSIDELPQFLNVLRGEMSVVGPRPPLRSEVDTYSDNMRRRLLVKQGVTGLWQVSGRSDLTWEDSVRLDLDYVENWTMLRDMQIIFRTARAVLASRGAY